MIYSFMSGKREQDLYVRHFGASVGAKPVFTKHFFTKSQGNSQVPGSIRKRPLPQNVTGIIFAGMLRGNAHLFQLAKQYNIDFYYIDHAYFNSGYKNPHWMRIIKNGFAQNAIISQRDNNRYKSNFNTDFKDYSFKDKKNIVVLPPSDVVSKVFDKGAWEEDVIATLRKHTDRPIVIRKKVGTNIDKLLYNPIKQKNKIVYATSLEEELENAYCVVAFNSSAALDALRLGIPVICDKFCPAYPLSHSLSQIENLQEKSRKQLFNSLACGQFTLEEARNIKTFNYINTIRQWSGKFP